MQPPNREQGVLRDAMASLADSVLPGVGPIVSRALGAFRAEWQRNTSVALRAAEQASGRSREDLLEALAENPRLQPLVTRVLLAAGTNGYDPVLGALGTAFGEAVADPERVDECELILTSLADLTATHAMLLHTLATTAPAPPPDATPDSDPFWTTETLLAHAQLPESVGELVLAALIGRGLAVVPPMTWGAPVRTTPLGNVVLEVLARWQQQA